MESPCVILDDRERASGLELELKRLLGASAIRVSRLALGDALVRERFVVERKTVADFVASRQDGRLVSQLSRLAASAPGGGPRGVIVLEGSLDDASRLGLDPELLRAWAMEAALAWRLPLVQAADARETARWIAALARQDEANLGTNPAAWFSPVKRVASRSARPLTASKRENGGGDAPSPGRSPLALQAGALAKIPGMGPARARALIERFGGISGVKAASAAQWREVPGIGPGLAQALDLFFQD